MSVFSAYLPMDRRQALAHNTSIPDRVSGTALFADISGFTPLTGALAKELGRKRGAEQVLDYINPIYEALVTKLYDYQGSVIGFAGDSITCWIEGDDGRAGVACALAMQQIMQENSRVTTPNGVIVDLSIKIGLANGPARRFLVGDPQHHLFEALAGDTLARMATAEGQADKGDIIVATEIADRLGTALTIAEWRHEPDLDHRFAVITGLNLTVPTALWPQVPDEQLTAAHYRPWIDAPVFSRLQTGADYIAELRPATSIFCKFSGLDYDGDDAAGEKLSAFIRQVQAILAAQDGYMLQLTIGDKGSNLLAVFGAPVAHEDDEARAVGAALALRALPDTFDFIDKYQLGISHGVVWAGQCGGDVRCIYSVMGDEVNMAARLMGKAQQRQILVGETIYENPTAVARYRFELLDPIMVKGRPDPLPVAIVTDAIAPAGDWISQTQAFVGREAELAQLRQNWAIAQQANGGLLLLTGGGGIGKTHLVGEWTAETAVPGVGSFFGTAVATRQQIAYHAWRPILQTLFQLDTTTRHAQQQEQIRQQIAQIWPGQEQRLPLLNDVLHLGWPESDFTAELTPELRQQNLFALIGGTFHAWANGRSFFIVFDNAHWLDDLSVQLARAVSTFWHANQSSFLLLFASRPLTDNSPLRTFWQSPPTGCHTASITLGPLDQETLLQLLAIQWGLADSSAFPAHLSTLLIKQSQGNPYFASELLHILHQAKLVSFDQPDPSGPRHCTAVPVERLTEQLPDSLHSVMLARLDALPSGQQMLLKTAAVLGQIFPYEPLPLLLSATEKKTAVSLSSELETLQAARLLQADQPTARYAFANSIVHDAVYQTLLFRQRQQLHTAIAHWYEEQFTTDLSPYWPALAFHYQRAEAVAEEIHYATLAGQQASQMADHTAAIHYGNRVLTLLPETDEAGRLAQLLQREQAHDMLGDRAAQATDLEQAATAAARLDANQQAIVALRHANYALVTGDYPLAIQAAGDAIRLAATAVADASTLIVQSYLIQGEALRLQGDLAGAISYFEKGIDHCDSLNDPALLAEARRKTGMARRGQGAHDAAAAQYQTALDLCQTAGDKVGEAAVLNNFGALFLQKREFATARDYLQQAAILYAQLGDRRKAAGLQNNLSVAARGLGDATLAATYQQQALQIFREIGDQQGMATTLTNMGNLARARRDYMRAERNYNEALVLQQAIGDKRGAAAVLSSLGLTAAAQGQLDAAEAQLQTALTEFEAIGDRLSQANTLNNLGAVAQRQHNKTQATAYWQQALALYEALGHQKGMAAVRQTLAKWA